MYSLVEHLALASRSVPFRRSGRKSERENGEMDIGEGSFAWEKVLPACQAEEGFAADILRFSVLQPTVGLTI